MEDKDGEKQNGRLGESGTGETDISILRWGVDVEIPPDTEMQVTTVNKVRRTRNCEKAVEVLQALAILEYIALGNA